MHTCDFCDRYPIGVVYLTDGTYHGCPVHLPTFKRWERFDRRMMTRREKVEKDAAKRASAAA